MDKAIYWGSMLPKKFFCSCSGLALVSLSNAWCFLPWPGGRVGGVLDIERWEYSSCTQFILKFELKLSLTKVWVVGSPILCLVWKKKSGEKRIYGPEIFLPFNCCLFRNGIFLCDMSDQHPVQNIWNMILLSNICTS